MITPFTQDLNIVAGASSQTILTCYSSALAQVDLSLATSVSLQMYITPQDLTPLVTVTTTSGPSGQLTLGVAPPIPAGLFAASQAALAELGTAAFITPGLTGTIVATVASVAALTATVTTGFALSNVALITGASPSGFYQWSPGDVRTPNGTTIVAGNAGTGNWLLFGTVVINLTSSASLALAGWDRAQHVITVTWSDGTTTQFISGKTEIGQPVP